MAQTTSLAPPDVQANLIKQPGIYRHVPLPFRVTVTPTKSQTGIPSDVTSLSAHSLP